MIASIGIIFLNDLVAARTFHGTFALPPLFQLLVWTVFTSHAGVPVSLAPMAEAVPAIGALNHWIGGILREIYEQVTLEAV
jgi:hypothetical protein